MNPVTVSFINEISQITDDNDLIAIATGVAIGRRLVLPADYLVGKTEEFNNELITTVRKYVNTINELKVVDTDLVLQVAKATYVVRFNAMYPDTIIVSDDECILCDTFSISSAFSGINLESANSNKEAFVKVISLVTSVINTVE